MRSDLAFVHLNNRTLNNNTLCIKSLAVQYRRTVLRSVKMRAMSPTNFQKEPDWGWFWTGMPVWAVKAGSWYGARLFVKLLKDYKREIRTGLELGGGPGLFAKIVAQKIGFDLTLIDNNEEGYKLFKDCSNFGKYILKDFFEYFPDEKFDLVFSIGVIEHYFERQKRIEVLKIHKRLSKKFILVAVPKESFLVRNFAHLDPKRGYEKLYTRKELEDEVREAGLKPTSFGRDLHVIAILAEV